jgi:HAD superfamily hydrolase (TIGR01459 family)
MSGFGALAENYDGFIVDLWGVVHDGVRLFPGVLECLIKLRAAGKRVVFLSNAPRRTHGIGQMLASMGVTADLYEGIMSSGEAVYLGLRDRTDEFAKLGRRIYHLGPARDRNVFDVVPGYEEAGDPAAADFLLNTGPDDEIGPQNPELYWPVLRAALRAGLPMICANPDLEVSRDGKLIICAGFLAEMYKGEGGSVIARGKPDPAIYVPVMAMLNTARERTLAIGDSLRTDIAGAKAAGIDSLWVLSGIHALHPDEAATEAAVSGLSPKAILPGLAWG